MSHKVIFIFLDGVGVGKQDPSINPFTSSRTIFNHFLDSTDQVPIPFGGELIPLDATLGLDGLPQSATGQTALFTGVNASQLLGHHLYGFPNDRLKQVLEEHSFLKRVNQMGKKSQFFNAFRPLFFEMGEKVWEVHKFSCTCYANKYAGNRFLSHTDIEQGKALYHDFTNQELIDRHIPAEPVSPEKAGEILAKAANDYDCTLYEHFITDKIGHSQDMEKAKLHIYKLERFFISLLEHSDLQRTTLFVTSDHGNLEDLSWKGHTRNPAFTMVWGEKKKELRKDLKSLTDVTPFILNLLTD